MRVVPKLRSKYGRLVLTEYLPVSDVFEHNIDKPAGPSIRYEVKSGVVLTSAPFNLTPHTQRELCRVSAYGGNIVTTVYQFSG